MKDPAIFAAAVIGSYLLGSVPTGLLLARLKGVDIRTVGSGNIGATNVFRSVSKGLGILTFVLDFLKGFLPAFALPLLAARLLNAGPHPALSVACGCASVLGHNWSIFLRFAGGKGVATSAGVLAGVAPGAVGAGVLGWMLLFAVTRYVSVASIGTALVVAVAGWLMYLRHGWLLPSALTALAALVIVRHRSNIERLLKGTEHRFQFRRSGSRETARKEKI